MRTFAFTRSKEGIAMGTLDIIIILALILAIVLGLIKGVLKTLFTFIGVFVITTCVSLITPFTQTWLEGVISDPSTRSLIAMVAAYVILIALYLIIMAIVLKLLDKGAIGFLNRVLGMVVGIVIVYIVFALICQLCTVTFNASGEPKEFFQNSWVYRNIYSGDKNFFGKLILNKLGQILSGN